MNFSIRYCIESDFNSILSLLQQLWPNNELIYNDLFIVFKKAINSDMQKLIVSLIEGDIVGFCSLTIKNNLWQAGNLGHVDELVVDEKYRGQGIGKKLIDEITRIAREQKCKRIELDSAFHRKEAHVFYEKLGYVNRAFLFSKELN